MRLIAALGGAGVVLMAMADGAWAQAEAQIPLPAAALEAVETAPRPKVGLVLSGGGARGFAHIGVIKVLEELGVQVEVLTATSMGSIVGGGYAAGYTAGEMEQIVADVDWAAIFAARAPREDLNWRRKEDDYKNLAAGEIGLSGGKPSLPAGALSSQNLELFLRSIAKPVGTINNLDRLPIPFAAMATNLESGKLIVMQKDATLEQAMRASMSVPGAFPPFDFRGSLLVDGGLVRNLPVDIARKMGADVVIAVNVGTPLSGRSALGNLIGVAGQMINILTEQNVEVSLAELRPQDILITPDLKNYSAADFSKADQIIAAGEAAARRAIGRLNQLAVSPTNYRAWNSVRMAAIGQSDAYVIDQLKVEGLTVVNPDTVTAAVDLPRGRPVTADEVAVATRRVWGSGDFQAVPYRFDEGLNNTQTLVLTPIEKPWGYNTLRLGGSVQTDFGNSNTFNLLVAHTWSWLNNWGGEWRNELQVGENGRLLTEFYQPLGAGSRWYLMPRLSSLRESFDVYHQDQAIARMHNKVSLGELRLGYLIGRLGHVSVGAGYARVSTDPLVGDPSITGGQSSSPVWSAEFNLDTLDSVSFPTSGYRLAGSAMRFEQNVGSARRDFAYTGEVSKPITIGRWTTVLDARAGRATQEGAFRLGGIFNLSGSPYGRFTGSNMVFGRAMISRNISDALGEIRMPIYAGISLELGKLEAPADSFLGGSGGWQQAGSLFLGANSPIGPMYFALGKTVSGSSAMYLYWGRPQ
ncbi:MAG: patatin-like phospholipase family protein [Burkholderiaceae bacterium]